MGVETCVSALAVLLWAYPNMAQNISKIDNHGALWHTMGTVHTTTSYAHLHIPIRTIKLKQRQRFMESISERFQILEIPEDWPDGRKKIAQLRLRELKYFVSVMASDTVERINEVLGATHPADREERQVIMGALAIGAAAGAIGGAIAQMFTTETCNNVIKQSQEVIAHTVEENLIDIHNNQDDISQLNKTIAVLIEDFHETFSEAKRTLFETSILRASLATLFNSIDISKKTRAILMARRGMLDPENFNRQKLSVALNTLNGKAVRDGYKIQTMHPDDLSSLPTSFLVDTRNEVIHLITHIPLFSPGNQMTFLRYIDAPLLLPSNVSDSPLYLEFNPRNPYLAVTTDGTIYQEMTENDLDSCHQKGQEYCCPLLGRFKRARQSCLLALYGNDPESIKRNCPLTVSRPNTKVEKIDKENWLIVETETTELRIQCQDGYHHRTDVRGNYIISLREGCDVNTEHIHIHQPKYEGDVVVKGVLETPVHSPNIWIDEGSEPHFNTVANELLTKVGQKAPLEQINTLAKFKRQLHEAELTSLEFSWPKWTLQSLLPSLTSVIAIIAGLLAIRACLPLLMQRCCPRRPGGTAVFSKINPEDVALRHEQPFDPNEIPFGRHA